MEEMRVLEVIAGTHRVSTAGSGYPNSDLLLWVLIVNSSTSIVPLNGVRNRIA